VKSRGSWRDCLLDVEWRRQATIAHADGGNGRLCLLFGLRGDSSHFLADESHHPIRQRRAIERALHRVARAFRKVCRCNDSVHARHARGHRDIY
jgi:hypothetical protein